jgi:hypothetical protein
MVHDIKLSSIFAFLRTIKKMFSKVNFNDLITYIVSLFIVNLLLLLSPVIVQLIFAFYLWKQGIIILANYLGKDFYRPFASEDLHCISDDFYGKPNSVISALFVLEGLPDKFKIVRDLESIYGRIDSTSAASRIYWKLSCFPVKWFGYWFWKRDKSFDIENHVEFVQDAVCSSEEKLPFLMRRLMRKSFQKHKPLWDITVVPNYERSTKALLVFRASHALLDAFSFVKFYHRIGKSGDRELFPMEYPRTRSCPSPMRSPKEHFLFLAELTTSGVYQCMKTLHNLPDRNCIQNWNQKQPSGEWFCALVPKIGLDKIRTARLSFKTNFFDIVFAAVVGGLRSYILKYYSESELLEAMHTLLPAPMPNHPDDDIVNEWY